MQQERVVTNYVDQTCGFPVVIDSVQIIEDPEREVAIPIIDHGHLEESVLHRLTCRANRLTGHQVRFIRHFFEMSQPAFSAQLNLTHPAIQRWESMGDEEAGMKWPTEVFLRIWVSMKLRHSDYEIVRLFEALQGLQPEEALSSVEISLQPIASSKKIASN
jgi:DNA-binding transcriptional regulator YiaG